MQHVAHRKSDEVAQLSDERDRLLRIVAWCRPRLSKDGYCATLDRMLENPTVPDHTPIVQSDAAYANGAQAVLQRLWAIRERTADEPAWADCEAMVSSRRGR